MAALCMGVTMTERGKWGFSEVKAKKTKQFEENSVNDEENVAQGLMIAKEPVIMSIGDVEQRQTVVGTFATAATNAEELNATEV